MPLAKVVFNVIVNLLASKWLQHCSRPYALVKGMKLWIIEPPRQFELTYEHNLQ